MFFTWLQRRRRRRLLATPFPLSWHKHLDRNVRHFALLSDSEKSRLCDSMRIFIDERHWEGCRGLSIDDEIQVTIAAQACLLVLGLDLDCLRRVKSILVYPGGFRTPFREYLDSGEVIEGEDEALGQTGYGGPVAVAWDEVLAAGRGQSDGLNPVLHEFAHQLDYLDGVLNGTPLLSDAALEARWAQVMTAEYDRLLKAALHNRRTILDPYGATNEGEFFAVATECFFETPAEMIRQHPQLYEVLRAYYRQDPAQRLSPGRQVVT
jgi:Mlc titration factor MtfA (ptsG expression regulator)